MNEFVKFLTDYKELFIGLACFLVGVLSLFFGKKKVVISERVLDGIYSEAIQLIQVAEAKYIQGSDKLEFVVSTLKEKYPNLSAYFDYVGKPNSFYSGSNDVYKTIVESILSTPQKKEVKK